ncbi:hypothetical protein [Massilia sp. LjRoot122]|uniref:hypothetical protein n=1 Tax=Massilia sp. LjRoot122 TaxID=3342257 RepID=UPI003ECFD7A5
MNLKRSFTRAVAAFMACLLSATPAQALTFTDFLNLAQNTFGARAGIQNEINSARQLIQQINAAKDMARSVKGLKDVNGLAAIRQTAQLYGALVEIDESLSATLDRNSALVNDLRAQYGASNLTFEAFADSLAKSDAARQRANRERFASVSRSMSDTTRRRQEIVSQLAAVQGQTEAMQTLGVALDVIIGQNQQVVARMQAEDKMKVQDEDVDAGKQQWAENQRALYQKRLREAANQF